MFKRCIERGNLLGAELAIREMGVVSLEEALDLTALIAFKAPERRSRFAIRWLLRLLQEDELLTIEETTLAGAHRAPRERPCFQGLSVVGAAGIEPATSRV